MSEQTAICLPEGLMTDAFGNERKRYVRVILDCSTCVCTPEQAAEPDMYPADGGYEFKDVYLSEQEHDALPDFDGF